ncbi:MAG: hypothetical protein M4579_002907 [Chaenotheca gracillima]|nr:MAG: hypothetical protein M4579_002907 [Chaenotheca gracillima]
MNTTSYGPASKGTTGLVTSWGNDFGESPGRPVLRDIANPNLTTGFHRPRIESSGKPSLRASAIHTVSPPVSHSGEENQTSPRRVERLPGATQNPYLSLAHPKYELDPKLVENLTNMGIKTIYPWQSSCLLGRGLLQGEQNLVYTAPTGGGKSLVADVLMLKKIIEQPTKKAILVLPYVALVQEKSRWLRRAVDGVSKHLQDLSQPDSKRRKGPQRADGSAIRVVGYFGGSRAKEAWADVDIAVCTIEKANSLVNAAIDDGTIADLGTVVLDELHMIDDDHRGYLMELIATKVKTLDLGVQMIGMSATLSNTELLAKWLGARFYRSKYQPVPIEEFLVYENAIYPAARSVVENFAGASADLPSSQSEVSAAREIEPSPFIELKNPMINAVVSLTMETVQAGYSALVFCSSRSGCERDAALISEVMPAANGLSPELIQARKDVLSDLRNTSVGLEPPLENAILRGVGFHHAGLTTEERDIIAAAYDNGTIKVIVATCSLAAGINLPARRVILHGARMGRDLVAPAMLRQMRGRAGRKGKDELGESYLCCQKSDLDEVISLIEADLPHVESRLNTDRSTIKRALLEVIVTRLATTVDALQTYVKHTLWYHSTNEEVHVSALIDETIASLIEMKLIVVDSTDAYEATLLGQAIVASSLTPEDGIFVHDEIKRALQAFVMDGDMHIFYMFTPPRGVDGRDDINWRIFRDQMDNLDDSGMRVLGYVGINPAMVNRLAQGASLKESTPAEISTARTYRRFYAAFQLRDLCNEMPVHAVAKKYDVPRGFVQSLAQSSHGFAAGMIKFCERMQWGMLAAVLEHMRDRLEAGARADLLDLAKIPFIKSRTARVFWENGMKSVRAVAAAEPKDIVPLLLMSSPRKIRLDETEEERHLQKLMVKAEIVVNAANKIWEQDSVVFADD